MQLTRLESKLADGLGLAQAARTAAGNVVDRSESKKLRKQANDLVTDWGAWQESLNSLVVGNDSKRDTLLARAAQVRDATADACEARIRDGDLLDALESLAGLAAQDVAHWRIVRELARAEGDKRATKLAERALPQSRRHLKKALKACEREARREAESAKV